MRSVLGYLSPYVRSLERERDLLLSRLLEIADIRPLEEGPPQPLSEEDRTGTSRAMSHAGFLQKLQADSLDGAIEEARLRAKRQVDGGDHSSK